MHVAVTVAKFQYVYQIVSGVDVMRYSDKSAENETADDSSPLVARACKSARMIWSKIVLSHVIDHTWVKGE